MVKEFYEHVKNQMMSSGKNRYLQTLLVLGFSPGLLG